MTATPLHNTEPFYILACLREVFPHSYCTNRRIDNKNCVDSNTMEIGDDPSILMLHASNPSPFRTKIGIQLIRFAKKFTDETPPSLLDNTIDGSLEKMLKCLARGPR